MKNVGKTMRAAAILAVVGAAIVATGCQTVKGAGQDIQNAGTAGEKAIDKATK